MEPNPSHLGLLLKVSEILHSHGGLKKTLVELLEEVVATLGAERGFVVMRRHEQLEIVAKHEITEEEAHREGIFSTTAVWRVIDSGQPVVALNALEDPQLQTRSIQISRTVSLLVSPLAWAGEVRGAIYIDNSVSAGIFREIHRDLLMAISRQAGRALEAAALYEELQQVHLHSLDTLADQEELEEKAAPEALERMLRQLQEPTIQVSAQTALREPAADCQVSLFGELSVKHKRHPTPPWKSKKDRELFAYLAVNEGRLLLEDHLAEMFWPKASKPRHSLQNAITQIRKVLRSKERLERRQEGYALSAEVWTDLSEFRAALKEGKEATKAGNWDEALRLCRSAEQLAQQPLLHGVQSEWIVPYRQKVEDELVKCQSFQAAYFAQRGKHLLAIELWKRVLEIDSCHDKAHTQLITAYLKLERRTEAQKAYQQAQESYRKDLDMEPPGALERLLSQL